MRKGLMIAMLLGGLLWTPSVVERAAEAYEAKRYQEAAKCYLSAFDLYPGQEAGINFNAAQALMHIDSVRSAMGYFGKVTNGKQNPQFASWAWTNLGCIFASDKNPAAQPQGGGAAGEPFGAQAAGPGAQQQQVDAMAVMEQALRAFKEALKLDNNNDLARYNYELLKRRMQQQQQQEDQNQDQQQDQQKQQQDDQQQQQDQQQQNQPQPKENNGNQQQGEGGEGEQMSAAEADRLLEAMNSNEKKFLQQLEKGRKRRTYNDDGPDW